MCACILLFFINLFVYLQQNDPIILQLSFLICIVQAAHIGVGISGREGLQATLASDYAIAQVGIHCTPPVMTPPP